MTQHRMWERQLIAEFGNFTTEALWFGKDLQSITVYSGDRLDGIFGISIKTSSNTSCVGTCCTERKSITLDAPREIVTEIDTQVSNFYSLSITVGLTLFAMYVMALAYTYTAENQLRAPVMLSFRASDTRDKC